jgi:phage tail-like protein
MAFGTSAGYFLVEFDGVAQMEATEVSEVKLQHEPVQIHVGTREKPLQMRGKSTVPVVTVKHARVLIGGTASSIYQWFNDFHRGVAVERRNLRIVALDEDGLTPFETADLIDCVPTDFVLEAQKGDSKEASMFSFAVQPQDIDLLLT